MNESKRIPGHVYMNDHPMYTTWNMMKQRCRNPNHFAFKHYGGRGIKVCDRWLNSFFDFLEDIGPKPSPEHTLDRYPNKDGDYEPGNIRWATMAEQNKNRRGRNGTIEEIKGRFYPRVNRKRLGAFATKEEAEIAIQKYCEQNEIEYKTNNS